MEEYHDLAHNIAYLLRSAGALAVPSTLNNRSVKELGEPGNAPGGESTKPYMAPRHAVC